MNRHERRARNAQLGTKRGGTTDGTPLTLMWRQRPDGLYEVGYQVGGQMDVLPGTFESEAEAKTAIEAFAAELASSSPL
jgi:hypothetical protein